MDKDPLTGYLIVRANEPELGMIASAVWFSADRPTRDRFNAQRLANVAFYKEDLGITEAFGPQLIAVVVMDTIIAGRAGIDTTDPQTAQILRNGVLERQTDTPYRISPGWVPSILEYVEQQASTLSAATRRLEHASKRNPRQTDAGAMVVTIALELANAEVIERQVAPTEAWLARLDVVQAETAARVAEFLLEHY
jgi:hypothetical protein